MAVWTAALFPFLVAFVVLLLPGAVIAFAGGMRCMSAVGLAPLLSVSVLSVSAVVAPYLGLAWGVLPALLGVALAAGATLGVRAALARRFGWRMTIGSRGFSITPSAAAGLLFGSGVILYRLLQIFGDPQYVSQTADNVFHLNAVRHILVTGDASSLTVGAAGGGAASFYPAAWHGIVALVTEISGFPIAAAVACLNLVIGAVAWPLSMWFFCRVVLGGSALMNVGFGVLISAFSAFPYLLVDWGVLYPNYLGMAILPSVAGVVVLMFGSRTMLAPHRVMLPWFALVGLAGISLSHPNTILCLIALLLPLGLGSACGRGAIRVFKAKEPRQRLLYTVAAVVLLAATLGLWLLLRPFPITMFNTTWPPYQSTAQALGEAIGTTHSMRAAAWVTGLLVVLGLHRVLSRAGQRWLAASFALWTLLFVAATAWQPSVARAALTGGWFDDYKRIAAGMVVAALPLALAGFLVVTRRLADLLQSAGRGSRFEGLFDTKTRLIALAAAAVVGLPIFLVSQSGPVRDAAIAAKSNYNLRPGSPIMSEDEFKLYSEIPEFVPDDAVIAGNPWDGSAWAYFVSGRQVLFPHVLATMNPDKELIASSLNRISDNPAVCAAAQRLNVEYAINSDELIYLPGNPNNTAYPGLAHLNQAPGFELVAQVGTNRLYRLLPCAS